MTSRGVRRPPTSAAVALALLLALSPEAARAAGIVTTAFGSDQALVYATPNAGLPNPTATPVSGLPDNARPRGVSCFDADTCLIADGGNFRIFVVKVSTASVVDTIPTGFPVGYSGGGTLAVSPDKTFALALDPFAFSGQLTVIAAPFGSGSVITKVPLSGAVQAAGTQTIAFQPNGRAFACTGTGIAVFDPPYTAVAFTIPLFSGCGELATTPDGNTLLAPLRGVVNIFKAPFSIASTPEVLNVVGPTGAADGLSGAAVTPDGSRALVADTTGTAVWAIVAPFGAASAVEEIQLPPGTFQGLRQIAVSPDTQLAIVSAGGSNPRVAFVRPPFTAAGASVFDVFIFEGSGAGGVTFLGPAGPPGQGPPPCTAVAVAPLVLGAEARSAPRAVGDPQPVVAALLPSSRSVRVGCPATAFVSVINASAETATGVGVAPATAVAADFLYQTTDPATNALIGTPNTPADIPAGQSQSYLIALTPRAAFDPVDVAFAYAGTNTVPVPPLTGLNTLLLTASVSNVPDLVALAATIGNTGIVNLPAATNVGAFAVATVNLGLGADITVSADTGTSGLALSLLVCQTDAGGGCVAPAAASVTTFIGSGATPTFAFFVAGQNVAFDPAVNRVFARLKDGGGITRGSTSVAVQSTP